jgi:REP element-mobilizing transposase RayT
MYLAQEPIARVVLASLRRGVALGHYDLAAYAVLSNHVHLLLLPRLAPSRLLQSLQGATAREANRILGRTGESFWQAESYDHWVRDEGEWQRIATYIEDNPVKAGLVLHAEDYPWSSAFERGASAETSLRTPEVAREFRCGREIDLSQFSVAHSAPCGRGSVSADCVSAPRPQGAGGGPQPIPRPQEFGVSARQTQVSAPRRSPTI